MATFIEVIAGPNPGARFRVQEGMTLGRSNADIIIKDPKVSATHAKVTIDGKGQLVVTDLNSSNGLLINSRRVKKVSLIQGVTFEIGRTQFRVLLSDDEPEVTDEVKPEAPRSWRQIIREKLTQTPIDDVHPRDHLESFSPAIKLQFVQGIQADEEILLGYGPRRAGSDCLDIELLDKDAPKEAFELLPGPGMVKIRIIAQGQVNLNNKSIDSEMLKDGDLISFGTTLIKVSYL